MKKSIFTIMLGGLILLLTKYVFGDEGTFFFYINNLSTIESVVLYHYPDLSGPQGYHCPYGTNTNDNHGPNKYAIPPMSTVEIQFTSINSDHLQFYGQLPDALLPISPIYQWQSEADFHVYWSLFTHKGGYSLHQHNIFANSGFYDAMYLTNGAENINYVSSFCPTIQDANNMLNNYRTGACPNIATDPANNQTFVDPQWRLWSIRCSNDDIESVTKFLNANITVYPKNNGHSEEIDCNYINTQGKKFNVIFTNLDSHVLLPIDGQGGWSTQGVESLSGIATCQGSSGDPIQCQWAYASESY